MLEGLHEAVSNLLGHGNSADTTSVISNLSELSGAIGSLMILPQRITGESPSEISRRKSTSVLNLANVGPNTSRSDLLGIPQCRTRLLTHKRNFTHSRRKSMSENNLARICLDETDEELDGKEDDLDDLRPRDYLNPRTSSSGSYNSYRSTDSGIKLSASPSYFDNHLSRRFAKKSDSIDSGVRGGLKEEATSNKVVYHEDQLDDYFDSKINDTSKKGQGLGDDDREVNARVDAWCLQSAEARKSFFLRNLNATTIPSNRERMFGKGLSRTLSESHKSSELPKTTTTNITKVVENKTMPTKHSTVYEEIKDVLKPLTCKKERKDSDHDYEEVESIHKDIKRSYSFQEKTQAPPLPPRRPKSFSPDPWLESNIGKSSTLKKIFTFPFGNKSHSQDSMLGMENTNLDLDTFANNSGLLSTEVATVQALGTLPRPRRRSEIDIFDRHKKIAGSPKISSKQVFRSNFGISPSKSPSVPRPKHLFFFKSSKNELSYPSPSNLNSEFNKRKYDCHGQRTSSNESSLADLSTPDTSNRTVTETDTPDTGDESSVMKRLGSLRRRAKDKFMSIERKPKNVIRTMENDLSGNVPNSVSLDNFYSGSKYKGKDVSSSITGVKTSSAKGAIQIPRNDSQECGSNITTPSSLPKCSSLFGRPGTPPATDLPLRNLYSARPSASAVRTGSNPPPKQTTSSDDDEPKYVNLEPDPDYMTVDELTGLTHSNNPMNDSFLKTATLPIPRSSNNDDTCGYLSMGDIRHLKKVAEIQKDSSEEHEYMSMEDIPTTTQSYEHCKVINCATSSMDRRQTHHYHPHHNHHTVVQHPSRNFSQMYKNSNVPQVANRTNFGSCDNDSPTRGNLANKSAPGSRKASISESSGSEYLTPTEVGHLLRRELLHTATCRSRAEHQHQRM